MFLFTWSDLTTKDWWMDKLADFLVWITTKGVKFVLSLIITLIALRIVNIFTKKFYKSLMKKNADKTLARVLFNVVTKALKILIIIMFLGYIGIETASISALIASLGVGIGLAMQGALSNLAGGILIILTRPFNIGDYIEAEGKSGTVEDINIFYTNIVTPDNVVIMIPNGSLANGVIVNKSIKDTRRVDEVFSISYESDYLKAEAVIIDVCKANDKIFIDPAPFCRISSHSESSIDLTTRVWCNASDYWDVHFYLLENVKTAFEKNNIEIPYNKLDVNLLNK
ncbi:MAG: mechanosensitive ion channel family protein [Anaeroplasmataceae bacterium]